MTDNFIVHVKQISFFLHFFKCNTFNRYADILAGKLQQKVTSVRKIEATRKLLKEKIEQFKSEKASIQPLVGKLTEQTKMLQDKVTIKAFESLAFGMRDLDTYLFHFFILIDC